MVVLVFYTINIFTKCTSMKCEFYYKNKKYVKFGIMIKGFYSTHATSFVICFHHLLDNS